MVANHFAYPTAEFEFILAHISAFCSPTSAAALAKTCRSTHAVGTYSEKLLAWRWRWRRLYLEPLRPRIYARSLRERLASWRERACLRAESVVISVEALNESNLAPISCREPNDDFDWSTHVLYFKLRRRTPIPRLVQSWCNRSAVDARRVHLYLHDQCLYDGNDEEMVRMGNSREGLRWPLALADNDMLRLLVRPEEEIVGGADEPAAPEADATPA